jgi:hypothetical protein
MVDGELLMVDGERKAWLGGLEVAEDLDEEVGEAENGGDDGGLFAALGDAFEVGLQAGLFGFLYATQAEAVEGVIKVGHGAGVIG